MHVVLVGPELEENLSLRYLRGALEAEGHSVQQVDFNFRRDLERCAAEIAASGAAIAGFSMVFTRRAREFADLITRCRELGYRGLTIAGGHFATFHADLVLRDVPALDLVAIGEGERILCDLARSPGDFSRVAGLVLRDGDGVRRTPAALPEQDLDRLPWAIHRRPFDRFHGLPIVNMLGSRGCSYACGFCSIAAWHRLCGGARYRTRSARGIAAEMGCLWREGVRLFNFHDDNFLGRDRQENLRRVQELRDALQSQGIGQIGFQIKARPDAVDPELFSLLRSMGLFRVFLGIEAGTEQSLRNLGRGQSLADNTRALDILNSLDLHVAFNLLVLNPESTFEDLAGNVRFLAEHSCNPMNFCRTELYAGTPLERRLRTQGRLSGDYWGLDYEIADARAQRAFELFTRAFFERNFGAHPLHYLSSQVDYEHQVRMDFFGTTPALRAMARQFVRDVNANTVGYLQEVLDRVARGVVPERFAEELALRVKQDDVRLHDEGQRILERLRELPTQAKARPGRARGAMAASVAIALASCTPSETQPMEAAPPPPPRENVTQVDRAHQDDGGVLMPQVMEAAPAWTAPLVPHVPEAGAADASSRGKDAAADAKADAKAEPSKKELPPPYPMEAAPPPPGWRE